MRRLLITTLAVVALACFLGVPGCAVGFDTKGTPVVGLSIGDGDADAAERFGRTAGGIVGGLFGGSIGAEGGAVIGGTLFGGLATLLGWRSVKRERAAKAEADAAFDEGVARAAGGMRPVVGTDTKGA
jgi:hypothetical protein